MVSKKMKPQKIPFRVIQQVLTVLTRSSHTWFGFIKPDIVTKNSFSVIITLSTPGFSKANIFRSISSVGFEAEDILCSFTST